MRDLLPTHLVDTLRDRLIAGVVLAEDHFEANSADEDALTGALGQSLAMKPVTFFDSSGSYQVSITYRKIRGRGMNAPERLYGCDGVFQISLTDEFGVVIRQKGLPFQAKTNWRGTSKAIVAQSKDIQSTTGGGLVIDYSPKGYKCCRTGAAIEAQGNRAEVNRRDQMRPLGIVLGVEFLDCKIGEKGLFYNPDKERFFDDSMLIEPAHEITTRIVKRARND